MTQQEFAIYMDGLASAIDTMSEAIVYALGETCGWFRVDLSEWEWVEMRRDGNGRMRLWYGTSMQVPSGFPECLSRYSRETVARASEKICDVAKSNCVGGFWADTGLYDAACGHATRLKTSCGFVAQP